MIVIKMTEDQFEELICFCPANFDIDFVLEGCTFDLCSARFEKEPMDCRLCWQIAIKGNNLKIDGKP